MNEEALRVPRSLQHSDLRTTRSLEAPFYKPAEDSEEMKYLHERREALGGYLPQPPRQSPNPLEIPAARRCSSNSQLEGHRRPRDVDHDGLRAHA